MKDNREVTIALEKAKKLGKQTAIATVVSVTGSAYRREGAKMVIDEDGGTTGMISGGCLESDVAEIGKQVMDTGTPLLKQYDLDEVTVWGLGLGCPGIVDVFIEPVDLSRKVFAAWTACIKEDRPGVFATVLESDSKTGVRAGSHLFISDDNGLIGNLGDFILEREVTEIANKKLQQLYPKSETRTISLNNRELNVFIDVNVPPSEVMIFGAGHDAIPVASFARQLGFQVSVVDQRSAYVTEERFPDVQHILASPEQLEKKVKPGRRTFIVIMNHHIEKDQICLSFALRSQSPYVGVLGPRKRRNRMLDSLRDQGITFTEEQLSRMYNPIGMDIGADTPEEIAVSILSEILAVRNRHSGGHLRE